MRFSQQIEKNNQDIILAAVNSLFIQQLAKGTLSKKIFDYYVAQDTYFLTDFARASGICTSKAKDDDILFFIGMQKAAFGRLENMNSYYASGDGFNFTSARTPAQTQLSAFMLRLALHAPVEVAFCGLAPLVWLYNIVGSKLMGQNSEKHPYARWIEVNCPADLDPAIENYRHFIDRSAEANPALCSDMSRAARAAFYHLYCFWEDAYQMKDARVF